MGIYIKFSVVIILILNLLSVQVLYAAAKENTIQSFINKSLKIKLQDQASWYDLIHYRANIFTNGYTSQADSLNFFFAENGKTNPEAELIATILAMFNPVQINNPNEHPQCLFVARKNWLIDQMPKLESELPTIVCAEYNNWITSINPNNITLVFPSAYINNPGSMFGHTLLRIDQPKTNNKSNLTSYAITYAANTNETSGLIFAFKGLVGGYPGLFDILPYYDKVNEYNDLENRDIWEYELNFTPAESRRLLEHMWELRKVIFDYYFLDENCSYELLALLDVARPGINLAVEFPLDVIPVDTIRIIQEKKLVTKILYRPSLLTNLNYQLEEYSGEHLNLILALINGIKTTSDSELKSLELKKQIYILEIAYNYLQYLYKSNEINRPTYAKRSLLLLKARNKLSPDINISISPKPDISPEQGHRSSRLTFSVGSKSNSNFFEFGLRPAYHDLLDNSDGFVDGLQINFFDIYARVDSISETVILEQLDFVNVYSVKPRTRFFKPLSWKLNFGFRRLPVLENNETLAFNLNAARGISFLTFDGFQIYGLIEGTAIVHHRLKNSTSFGIGPNLGFLWQVTPSWKMLLDSSIQYYDSHNNLNFKTFDLGQSYEISKDLSIRIHWKQEIVEQDKTSEIKIGLNWYY